jgi:hypothetical protein
VSLVEGGVHRPDDGAGDGFRQVQDAVGEAERDQRDRHLDDQADQRERRKLDQAGSDAGPRQRRGGERLDQDPEHRHDAEEPEGAPAARPAAGPEGGGGSEHERQGKTEGQ